MGRPRTANSPHLTPEERVAVDLLLQGKKPTEIAAALNRHPGTIVSWRQSAKFQDELARRRADMERAEEEAGIRDAADAKARVRKLSHKALDELERLLEFEESAKIRLGAVRTALEWGLPKEKDGEGTSQGHFTVTKEAAELLLCALRESKQVEFVEVRPKGGRDVQEEGQEGRPEVLEAAQNEENHENPSQGEAEGGPEGGEAAGDGPESPESAGGDRAAGDGRPGGDRDGRDPGEFPRPA